GFHSPAGGRVLAHPRRHGAGDLPARTPGGTARGSDTRTPGARHGGTAPIQPSWGADLRPPLRRTKEPAMSRRLPTLLSLLLFAAAARAENRPGWRGPNADGLSSEKALPVRWSATENVRWKAALPGAGVSAPVVWGERVFVTSSDGRLNDRLHLLCFHRD